MAGRNDYIESFSNTIHQAILNNKAPWQIPWDKGASCSMLPMNNTTGNIYKGANAIYLLTEQLDKGYDSNGWMTYKQGVELGGHVRKGEKSTVICYADFSKYNAQQEALKRGVLIDAKDLIKSPMIIYSNVFNVNQFDGLSKQPEPELIQEEERFKVAQKLIDDFPVEIIHGGNRAFYSMNNDIIKVPNAEKFHSHDLYLATVLHEMGHATGHPTRLNREFGKKYGDENYAREELRAEIASFLMSGRLGLGHDPSTHISYLASWAKVIENDPKEIFRACADAEKICKYVGLERSLVQTPTKEQEERNKKMEEKAQEPAQEATQAEQVGKVYQPPKARSKASTRVRVM